MKSVKVNLSKGFRIVCGNRRSQAASMVIASGDAEGDPRNSHRGADQWLFVFSGSGLAISGARRVKLGPRSLLLIEKGDRHEIRAIGRHPLRTLNFYVPPAYTKSGEPRPRGRRKASDR